MQPEAPVADPEFRWRLAIRRDAFRWADPDPCAQCGEWVGHLAKCPCIPMDVPLVEVRPGCYAVHRHRIADAIRAACKGH